MKRTVKILAVIGILLLAGLLIGAAFLTGGCTESCPAFVDMDGDGRCDSEQAAPTLESESPDVPTGGVTPSSDELAETPDEPAATPDAITPTATETPPATATPGTVACPFGQVNDP